jgi:hypothetical protein
MDALDELYSARPEEFVETRKRLAKEFRERGEPEAAKKVQEARKPSLAAWAVNRLVRDFPKEMRALGKAGASLREAQLRMIQGGSPGDMQKRLAEARDLIARLTRAAAQVLRDEGGASEAILTRVSETLMASLADESRAEELARGQLTKEMEPSGFGLPVGVTPAPGRAKRAEPSPAERKRVAAAEAKLERAKGELADKQSLLEAAEAEEREAAERAEQAVRKAAQARQAVERGTEVVRRAEAELKRARR